MLRLPDAAWSHYSDRQSLVTAGAEVAANMWAEVNPGSIVESWTGLVPELTAVLSGAQLGAARSADPYLDEVAAWQELDAETASPIDPKAFAGAASDGRSLASLLMSPAFSTLQGIASGLGTLQSLSMGRQHLDTIARTQVADAGRVADGVALAARRGLDGYTRVVVGKTCSRCMLLAGKKYHWNAGFRRHPRCDCVHLPCKLAEHLQVVQNPRAIYDSMSTRERQRAGWSIADQRAIGDGADLSQVTNAHRGTYEAGGRRYTTQGATKHGLAGSRLKGARRLTPEQIYAEARDRDEALRLLHEHGYLLNKPAVVSRRRLALAADAPAPMAAGPLTGNAALDSVPVKATFKPGAQVDSSTWSATGFEGLQKPDPGAVAAVTKYLRAPWFANKRLRSPGEPLHDKSIAELIGGPVDTVKAAKAAALADRHIAALDRVMAQSRLPQDIVTYRGVDLAALGRLPDSAVGHSWIDPGFVSTATRRDVAEGSFVGTGVLLRITAPKGTPALALAGLGESEVLLGRGLTYRVTADHRLTPGSAHLLDVEIVPVKKAVATATADLSKMTVPQLREVAKERGIKIPAGSRKADIQGLLGASKAAAGSDLSKLTVPKLRELAKERGVAIPAKALKADIVAALDGAKVPAKATKTAVAKAAPAKKAAAPVKPKPLTIAQLKALAKANGVYLPSGLGRPDIIKHIEGWERINKRQILPAPVAAARKGTKALQEHISRIVDAPPGELDEALRVLDAQAALTPKTMLRLEGVQLPGMGSAEARRYAADVADSNGVYNFSGRPILRLNPHWGAEGYNDRYRAAIIERKLKGHQSGWSTPTGLPPGVGATLAHEYGHHVSRMFITLTGDSAALGSYIIREPAASRLLPVLNDALGANRHHRMAWSGDLLDPHSKAPWITESPQSVHEHLIDQWMDQNRALLEQKVSKYGSSDFLELLAEIWQEYSTMGEKARPHIRKIGRVMHELAEELA